MNQVLANPVEKAKEFARAIVESDEYKKFLSANEALLKDSESRRLLATYQSRQRWLKLGRFKPGLMDELKNLHAKVALNETIQNFNRTGAELTELLKNTDDLISDRIGRRFAFSEGGSCCG